MKPIDAFDAWLKRHSRRAGQEGWCLVLSGEHGLEIQADDMSEAFSSDDEAREFVHRLAVAGEDHALRALALIDLHRAQFDIER